MRGHEYRALAVLQILHEDMQYLVTNNWVKTCCCFIHDEELGIVGKCAGYLQFHLHAFGELSYLLFQRKLKTLDILHICGIIPFRVHTLKYLCHILCIEHIMERQLVKDYRYSLFYRSFVLYMVKTEQAYLAAVDVRNMQQTADSCGLSSAILPDKAHDTALRHIKADIIQRKTVIFFGNAIDLDRVFVIVHIIPLR